MTKKQLKVQRNSLSLPRCNLQLDTIGQQRLTAMEMFFTPPAFPSSTTVAATCPECGGSSMPQGSHKQPWPDHLVQQKCAWRSSLQLCVCGLGFVGLAVREESGWQTGPSLVGAVPALSGQARLRNSQRCFLLGLLARMGTELVKRSNSTLGTWLPGWCWYFKAAHVLTHGRETLLNWDLTPGVLPA